jgi:DNA-binding CsgD family transcriptional regulator
LIIELSSATWRRLFEATEIIHSHAHGAFHVRLFQATKLLFGETFHGFEVYGLVDGSHSIETDMPWPEARRADLLKRTGEVVPLEHPVFPLLLQGEQRPIRMSDLITQRQLHRTNLYNDLFKPADVRHQIAIPFASPEYAGGLTINREKDYSDEELGVAHLFSRQVLIAYRTGLNVAESSRRVDAPTKQFGREDLGKWPLTEREREVLWWLVEGKRNSEIGVILAISCRTVEVHLTSVFRKLEVESRTAAIARVMNG